MKRHKILIVDDEISFLNTIVDILEKATNSYKFYQTVNPLLAESIAETEHPDLVITDWEMPQLKGLDLIRGFKKNSLLKDIPIIMCTGVMTSSVYLKMVLEAGAVDFIRKPVDDVELVARVQSMLKLADSYSEIKKMILYRDKVFSIIAHDLQGSVGNSKTALDFIQSQFGSKLDVKLKTLLDVSRRSISTSFWLLENLLVWARAQQKQISTHFQTYDLTNIVDEVVLNYDAISQDKNIKINFEIGKRFLCYFDKDLITTVIRNLLANAIKFSPQNSEIYIQLDQNETHTTFQIKDSGTGISPENLLKLLNPNVSYSTKGTNNEKGSGLGFNLCQEFIKSHKGKIWVETELEKGSIFYFSLPNNSQIFDNDQNY